ncbi:hypothetical protein RFI_25304 [Reticulomyxa filosa]|uniref:Uncharacterized protein n=1 Tax=Reticulomyxa filosa TaxID=46433 RepID=X6MF80_RETFI|nr:hypothetical protein RFI_25304 [Reticulomyxa filosa]|eukprot:ETO12072.1 hypothetical protein RFI_25304 [Reticulomyxa filosa]
MFNGSTEEPQQTDMSLLVTKGKEILSDVVKFWNEIEYSPDPWVKASLDIHLLFEWEKNNVYVQKGKGAVQVMYPVNTLRNLALRYAHSDFVFLLDADFVPSADLHDHVLQNYRLYFDIMRYNPSPLDQFALVVPAWEVLRVVFFFFFFLMHASTKLITYIIIDYFLKVG